MGGSLIISFGSKLQSLMTLDACWYLDKLIWITVSSSGAWDNEMLWQVNNLYSGGYILFCTERQVGAVIVVFLTSASQVYFVCV